MGKKKYSIKAVHNSEYIKNIYVLVCIIILLLSTNISISATNNTEQLIIEKIYSESSDGFSKFLGTSDVHDWNDVRNNETGNQAYDDWNNYLKGILAAYNGKIGDMYVISRSFFSFNTSMLTNSTLIKSASLFLYGCGTNESRVCIVEWTEGQDSIDIDDYSHIGSKSFGISDGWVLNSYNEIPLNKDGINAINISGKTFFACREYDHDFLDVAPVDEKLAEYRNGHYFSDEPGLEKDPYLLIKFNSDENIITPSKSTPFMSFEYILFAFITILLIVSYRRSRFEK